MVLIFLPPVSAVVIHLQSTFDSSGHGESKLAGGAF